MPDPHPTSRMPHSHTPKGDVMSEKKCANPACSCIPADGQKFCSAHCESLKGSVEAICDCGHPGCKGDALEESVS
jgi:metallothionein